MAYENGHNVYNYCTPLFERYIEDNMIFTKALQIVQYFETRSDYPFCINELDDAIEKILNTTISGMAHYEAKFINYDLGIDQMEWDPCHVLGEEEIEVNLLEKLNVTEKCSKNFQNDLEAFCITLKPVFDAIYQQQDNLMQLKKVTYKNVSNRDRGVIRFIRNDDEYFDIDMNYRDVKFLIKTLEGLLGENDNERK